MPNVQVFKQCQMFEMFQAVLNVQAIVRGEKINQQSMDSNTRLTSQMTNKLIDWSSQIFARNFYYNSFFLLFRRQQRWHLLKKQTRRSQMFLIFSKAYFHFCFKFFFLFSFQCKKGNSAFSTNLKTPRMHF